MENFSFSYGSNAESYKNVTEIVVKNFEKDRKIEISNKKYNDYFTDVKSCVLKHLKIDIDGMPSLYVKENASFMLDLSGDINNTSDLTVVYFINCYISPYYKEVLLSQFLPMIADGFFDKAKKVYIVASVSSEVQKKELENLVLELVPKAIITFTKDNIHEYHGMLKVWELGKDGGLSDNSIIFYFHSKGISRAKLPFIPDYAEQMLAKTVTKKTDQIMKWFFMLSKINKCGWHCSNYGSMWHNYFFVRKGYVNTCPAPIIAEDRYYYEKYIGFSLCGELNSNNCLNMDINIQKHAFHIGSHYLAETNCYC